jgi:hypothetical protein
MRERAVSIVSPLLAFLVCFGCVFQAGQFARPVAQSEPAAQTTTKASVFWLTTPEGLRCVAFSVGQGRVVTAAHCIGASRSGTLTNTVDSSAIDVGRAVINPAWAMSPRVGTDAAVLREEDIGAIATRPVKFLNRSLRPGEVLTLITPSKGEKQCAVLGQSGPWIELSCLVEDGWSGAPLVLKDKDELVVAGILSGRGTNGQRGLAEASQASAARALLGR